MHFKKIRLMLKNSFKNATKSKTQLIGVTVLAFLLSLVLTLVISMNVRVLDKYQEMNIESRVHDAVIDLNPYDKVATGESANTSEAPKNLVAAQQYWLYKLQEKYYEESSELQFQWTRTEAREFSQVKQNDNNLTIKAITKTTQNNQFNNEGVDKLVIFEGQDIKTRHQVVIDPNYAKQNGIQIGDVIRIQADNLGNTLLVRDSANPTLKSDIAEIEKTKTEIDAAEGIYNKFYSNYQWFQVVGFGGSADFMTPIFNASTVLPSRSKEAMIYVSPESFGLNYNDSLNLYEYNLNSNGNLTVSSNVEIESFYSIKFTEQSKSITPDIEQFETDFRELIRRNSNSKIVYAKGDSNYRFNKRIDLIEKTIKTYTISAFVIFILILFVVLYTISLITKKQIENSSKQLGTLKALGYRKRILVYNFIMLPFITSTIGGFLGYILCVSLSNTLTNEFAGYFSLNYSSFDFDWISLVSMILIMWFILTTISFFIATLLMRKSSLSLISANFNQKHSAFKIWIRKIHIRKTFGSRLRKALLVDALGKMMAIGFVVLLSSSLFTISFAAPDILRRNEKATYNGIKYKQIVEFAEPSYNNPLTFAKTFKPDEKQQEMVFSKEAGGWTSLALRDNGKFDYDQIMSDFFNGDIGEKYYSIFINNLFTPSSESEYSIPTNVELAMANMKLLNLEGGVFDTNYFRQLSKFGIPAAEKNDILANLIGPMIIKQWFDYQNLFNEISVPESEQSIYQKGAAIQTFYAKYSESIGLSITNDFRNSTTSDKDWVEMSQTEKINIFNDSNGMLQKRYLENNLDMLKNLLNDPTVELDFTNYDNFKFTNSEYTGLGEFKIASEHNSENEISDYYLNLNFDQLASENSDESQKIAKEAITDMWKWFTFLFNNRVDQAIIQSAFSRPPYSVKQAIINAFNSDNNNYSMAFNLVSYDSDLESIGTKINAEKNGNNFKIYGIDEDYNRFLDLRDTNNNDLMDKLFSSTEANGIIINQSLAKSLNLKEGQEVDLNVIQNELQDTSYNGEIVPYELSDWDTSSLWSGKGGFKQNSRTNNLGANIIVNKPDSDSSNSINFLTSISSPTEYYSSVLNNETIIGNKITNQTFKVLGIQDGYGLSQAWIKNDDANKILQYDKVQEYLWTNFFSKQWNNQFGYTTLDQFNNKIIIEDKNQEELKIYQKIKDLDLTKNGLNDLDLFKNEFIYHPETQAKKELGELILQIFEKQYPVFNYKYSNKLDIADYNTAMSVSNAYGDYSPTALNGMEAKFSSTYQSFDGSGIGTVEWILPIDISKEMLKEISELILLLIAIAITLILSITFVIILLTTSVIITDNIRFISTMRVLGYHDAYVVKTVIGMYLVVITSMFAVGFAVGWFIFAKVLNIMALNGTVLPLIFPVWLPIVVFLGIVGIYAVAIYAGYKRITKTNSVRILQNSDI
ncbi:ABC transporter permease [Mesoplasma chauliocola]|uniref:ABC transporter permease n=1 Tax=Mesoplasma chauliocola TaxID=216427 RepID=A0A249SMP4_9MOLU|nr:ABC transporter permease [Mesoplasma chauliocola]ASZ08916.1 ABC transporter permease [Mesoplasma chauliocola]